MTVKLMSTDLLEMVEKFPIHTFSGGNELEENRYLMNNCNGKAKVTELKTCNFCMSDLSIRYHKDCKLLSETNNSNVFWFCALLNGNSTHGHHCTNRREETWMAGQANLLAHQNVRINDFYAKNKSMRAIHIMLSTEYMERIANWYPYLFENIVNRFLVKNHSVCFPGIRYFVLK